MKVNDLVSVKTDGGPRRMGKIIEVEEFSEGIMYLVALDDYRMVSGSSMRSTVTMALLLSLITAMSNRISMLHHAQSFYAKF